MNLKNYFLVANSAFVRMKTLYEKILQIINGSDKAALCTITSTKGSTPLKAGAKMIVWSNGKIFGTIGGGHLEKKVIEAAQIISEIGVAETFMHELLHQHGMCCGGIVEVFIEPIRNQQKLYIFGAGHVGIALARYARNLDFCVSLIDERKDIFPQADIENIQLVNTSHRVYLNDVKFGINDYIVVCTHDHAYDREILLHCLPQPATYLGMIGSMRKVKVTRKMFLTKENIAEADLDKVDMPIGIDIGGTTPNEIAISIMAKLIAVKNHHSTALPNTILKTLKI